MQARLAEMRAIQEFYLLMREERLSEIRKAEVRNRGDST